jgi:putative tricarboxylic transport membrane protein
MIRSSEFWGGVFWLALGAFIVHAGRDLGLGRVNDPGSGFILFWVGGLMLALGAGVVLAALRAPGPSLGDLWRDTRWGKVLFVIALLLAFGFAFEPIGFIPCTIVLLLALMLIVDPVHPATAVPIAILAPLAVWAAITKALKVQLPAGVLAPWLG